MVLIKRDKTGKWLRFGLGGVFSLLSIAWAIRSLDWRAVQHAFLAAQYGWVILAVVSVFLTAVVRTIRWGGLLHSPKGYFQPLFSALLIGQAVNYITPARMGDVLRIYLAGQSTGVSKAQALGTIALEKLWDIVMLVLVTLVLGWFFPLPGWLLNPLKGLIILICAVSLGLGITLWRQKEALTWLSPASRRLWPGFHNRLIMLIQNTLTGFSGLRDSKQSMLSALWSLIVWGLGGLTNYLVFLAFDLPLSLMPAFLLLIVLQVGVAVPSLPGRVGIFEAICVFVLAIFGVSPHTAFSYGLLLHVVAFIPPILLAAVLGLRVDWLTDSSVNEIGSLSRIDPLNKEW